MPTFDLFAREQSLLKPPEGSIYSGGRIVNQAAQLGLASTQSGLLWLIFAVFQVVFVIEDLDSCYKARILIQVSNTSLSINQFPPANLS